MQDTPEAPATAGPQAPPDLPKPLVDLAPPVIIGTTLWALALAVVLVLQYGMDRDVGFWPSTAIAGIGCGLVGLAIVGWQRRASRRGSKGAQRGL